MWLSFRGLSPWLADSTALGLREASWRRGVEEQGSSARAAGGTERAQGVQDRMSSPKGRPRDPRLLATPHLRLSSSAPLRLLIPQVDPSTMTSPFPWSVMVWSPHSDPRLVSHGASQGTPHMQAMTNCGRGRTSARRGATPGRSQHLESALDGKPPGRGGVSPGRASAKM